MTTHEYQPFCELKAQSCVDGIIAQHNLWILICIVCGFDNTQ
jgi:hypothetical protein